MTTKNAYLSTACLILSLLASFGMALQVGAQVSFETFPQDYQLFARTKTASGKLTGFGEAKIAGTIGAETEARVITAQLVVGNDVVSTDSATLDPANGTASFELTVAVPVTRTEHTLRVILDNDASLPVATARGIVAGDVYLVNGQSNAIGNYSLAKADRDSFLRGFVQEGGWTFAQFSNPGEWAGRAAAVISKRHDVPIAIFNFAVGAQAIEYFLPQRSGGGNYEEAVNTLNASGVRDRVRFLLWFQGETDGWESPLDAYRSELNQLIDDYTEQFDIEHAYGIQTRTRSCGHPEPYVMEAQRQVAVDRADFTLLASTNVEHDSCHFSYEEGYRLIGDRLADAIGVERFGEDIAGIYGPQLDSANLTGARELTLYYRAEPGAALVATGNPFVEFRVEGVEGVPGGTVSPRSGYVDDDRIVLGFDAEISTAQGVSYLSHAGPAPDFVHNANGVGALTFFNVPLGVRLERVTPVEENFAETPSGWEAFPNPVRRGATLTVKLPRGLPLGAGLPRVSAADGRTYSVDGVASGDGGYQLSTTELRAGCYYVRIGGQAIPFVVQR